jgi:hypothetical protein
MADGRPTSEDEMKKTAKQSKPKDQTKVAMAHNSWGIRWRIKGADDIYGPFASTHEALGVALEEWDEFRDAVRMNDANTTIEEALDLAAVLIRLARDLQINSATKARSTKGAHNA